MATCVKIQTVTVGSGGASSISFSSIPQTYTDLKIVYSLRCTTANVNSNISFNGSTSNVSWKQLYGNGASVGSNSGTTVYLGPVMSASTDTANTFGSSEIYIPNYISANNKSFSIDGVTENNSATAYQTMWAGLWSNTAAITSVSVAPSDGGNFAQYSTATLYGILNGSPYATGGNKVYTDGTYWYHQFLSTGTSSFIPNKSMSVDYFMIGGGGSGGKGTPGACYGAGGGAGGYRTGTTSVTATSYSIVVGAGGVGSTGTNTKANGGDTTAFGLTAGGGFGGFSGPGTAGTGGVSGSPQNNGGASYNVQNSSGGGGAGGTGSVTTGGVGVTSSLSGTSTVYGGGGGGSGDGVAGAGGSGIGGNGAAAGGTPTSGVANTGSGGGSMRGDDAPAAGSGGSGIVIIRYAV
jgi:hypothetical protein